MASIAYLDTHVVAWLYAGRRELIPPTLQKRMEQDDLLVSPIVGLELQYLYEIGRTTEPALSVLDALARKIGLRQCDLSFQEVAASALEQDWTRDPFDRIIVAHAAVRKAALITRDRTIREHYPQALWSH